LMSMELVGVLLLEHTTQIGRKLQIPT